MCRSRKSNRMQLSQINIRDPYVVLDNGRYYMYGTRVSADSHANCGVDVYVSDDLITWEGPAECFTPPDNFWADRDFWAPEVHSYQGGWYMFLSLKSEDRRRGTQILKADSPIGPFFPHSNGPVTPPDWECLDGTLWVENGTPYIVFCHEWVQVRDGEMCALPLTDDLSAPAGEPVLLFHGSDPVWSDGFSENNPWGHRTDEYITDGPFLYRTAEGRLIMLWSSFSADEYCEGLAYSSDSTLLGEWQHDPRMLFSKDGGHGMLFRDKEGVLRFVCHQPNVGFEERPVFFRIIEKDQTLFVEE